MKVTIVTGAGVSASGGIPTYRDEGGVWSDENFEKMSHSSRYGNYLEVLIPKWLKMGERMLEAEPTLFHRKVAEMGWNVITQNIDGLHQKAGSENIIEVHGSIMKWLPLASHKNATSPSISLSELLSVGDAVDLEELRIRPDVVLFGERPRQVNESLQLIKDSDVVVYAGTSGNVYPVADWALLGRKCVLVDPNPWGTFGTIHSTTTDEWAASGMPLE